ncbi:MAG TPA: ACP S-malonyltransferase [Myxococcota bacterium]|nr:ACP S-malonyltransferase [Myxococcota bacterium]HRY94890.1 ACP S-malonyltransferase [Myxococcota bacterium]HSA22667.1 ACP S-malonyltransferase [Myxococcota bacterium]
MAAANEASPSPSRVGPAFLFPGQGAQHVGMGEALRRESAAARKVFAEADEVLGWSVTRLCLEGPEDELTRTENLQPALFTVSMAAVAALAERGPLRPSACLGHSLGEYAALAAAGALSFADALRLVRRRGEAMGAALPAGQGAMAAVLGLDEQAVATACAQAAGEDVLVVANLNCPGQVVISGHARALARAEGPLQAAGARGILPLKVSAPFHSALMRPAAERLREALAQVAVHAPSAPVLSNASGLPHGDPQDIRRALEAQLVSPVRWSACVGWVLGRGVRLFLELGPGKVLAGLLKRIDRQARCLSVAEPADLPAALAALEAAT